MQRDAIRPAAEVTTAEKLRLLPWNIATQALNSVFGQLTFFGSAFILFLDRLGVDFTQIGVLLSLMPFFGVVALFIAPRVARFGYKRTYLTFWGLRKFITALLLLVPWVVSQYGTQAAITLVLFVVAGFALCRAIAETGWFPWAQDFIPNSVRGKHGAIVDMAARITGTLAIIVVGFVLGSSDGLEPFTMMFAVALVFGLLCVWSASHLPGGGPSEAAPISVRNWLSVFRDGNFAAYMVGLYLLTLSSAPLGFVPLFMQDQIGLSDSQIVWLQMGGIAGGFSAIYLIGWAADRYGSKPVMMTGLFLRVLLPLGWLLMPRDPGWGMPIALALAFLWGISDVAWMIGSGRLLYGSVVPQARKNEYLAVHYGTIGVVGGLTSILGGVLLDLTSGLDGQVGFLAVDPFTPWFIGTIILGGIATLLFARRIHVEGEVTFGEFASMFTHGNPFGALESLIRYNRSADERATVRITERMGLTNSALTVEELLDALKDPRFNVRFEAIISIARTHHDRRLVDALCQILDGTELSLSVIAAWALGRQGDPAALPTLRDGLNSQYRSIVAHCARSLGTLGDQTVAPLLHERLRTETDKGLRIAYASALGRLHHEDALDTVLEVLETTENEGARMELALAVTRIICEEAPFIRLLRSIRQDRSTMAAREVSGLKRRFASILSNGQRAEFDACAHQFARDAIDEGAAQLAPLLELLAAHEEPTRARVLRVCAAKLRHYQAARPEYWILPLALLHNRSAKSIGAKLPAG